MSDVPIDPANVNVGLFVQECETCKPVRLALDALSQEISRHAEWCEIRGRAVPKTGGAIYGRLPTAMIAVYCTECGGAAEILTVLGERLLGAIKRRLAPTDNVDFLPF